MIFLKDIKIIEHLCTYFIVSSLKVTLQNIIWSPRPFIFEFVGGFDLKQELFYFFFELPKGRSTGNKILAFEVEEHMQAAESIKSGMVSTQIGCVLLVALALINVVIWVVMMGYQLF
jgi:hypothetical protein